MKLRSIIFGLLVLLLPVQAARAAVTFDAAAQGAEGDWNSAAATVAVSGGCSNSILVAWLFTEYTDVSHSGVNSTAGTLTAIPGSAGSYDVGGGNYMKVSGWYRVGVSGSQTVTGTSSGNANEIVISAQVYCGVHQSSPLGTAVVENNGDASIVVAGAANDLVIDALALRFNARTIAPGAGQTERVDFSGPNYSHFGSSSEAGAASVTMSWTHDSTAVVHVGIALKDAGGGGGGGGGGGTQRYVSHNGSASMPCTNSASPCPISVIGTGGNAVAGDTWNLLGGTGDTYSGPSITINCASGHNNGTAGNPITIKAAQERLPQITTSGGRFLEIRNCSYYSVIGLRVMSHSATHYPFFFLNSTNLEFKRNLMYDLEIEVYHAWFEDVTDVLIEENECYDFYSGCTVANQFFGSGSGNHRITKRRNYCNPAPKVMPAYGNCFDIYAEMTDNTLENNIGELDYSAPGAVTIALGGTGGTGSDTTWNKNNTKLIGNIGYGFGTLHKKSPLGTATNTQVRNNLFILNNSQIGGIQMRNQGPGSIVENNTVKYWDGSSNTHGGMRHDCEGSISPTGTEGATWNNNLVHGFGTALQTDNQGICSGRPVDIVSHTGTSGLHGTAFTVVGGSQSVSNTNTSTMSDGGCPAFVRSSSPHKKAGLNSADIGANILYATEGGATNNSKELWVPSTRELNTNTWGGAVVSTVNGPSGLYPVNLRNFGSRLHPSCNDWPTGYGSVPPASPELIVQYDFNEGTGTTINDASANKINATMSGDFSWATGCIEGGCVQSGGTTGVITAPDHDKLDVAQFTILGWVMPLASFGTNWIAFAVKNYVYYFYLSSAMDELDCPDGSVFGGYETGNRVCFATPLPLNTWSHVALTKDGSFLTLYWNGAVVATRAASAAVQVSTGTLMIGASQYGERCTCKFDKFKMYNYARSASEIKTEASTGGGGIPIARPASEPVFFQW